jgi:hypothetical protein
MKRTGVWQAWEPMTSSRENLCRKAGNEPASVDSTCRTPPSCSTSISHPPLTEVEFENLHRRATSFRASVRLCVRTGVRECVRACGAGVGMRRGGGGYQLPIPTAKHTRGISEGHVCCGSSTRAAPLLQYSRQTLRISCACQPKIELTAVLQSNVQHHTPTEGNTSACNGVQQEEGMVSAREVDTLMRLT